MVGHVNVRGSLHNNNNVAREARGDDVITVRRGDTLSEIAVRYGVSLASLLAANPNIRNPDRIFVGQTIKIPRANPPAPSTTSPSMTLPLPREPEPQSATERLLSTNARRQPEVAVNIGAIMRRGDVASERARAAPFAPSAPPPGSGAVMAMSTTSGAPSDVSPAELQQIVPGMSNARANEVAAQLSIAMREANVTTLRQRSAFIAQLAHESGGFHYMEEIASGAQYEGRTDLGNTQPGDGVRFKGRGYIQITGRHNYTQAGQALGLDLVNHPELAALPENAARIAAWYWTSRNINDPAERGDFVEVTRRINGGTNGLADRQRYYDRALNALQGGGAMMNQGVYVVAPGDTLSGIAQRFNTSVATLMQLNPQITNPDSIMVGQELRLPNSAPPPPAIDVKHQQLGGNGSVLGAPMFNEERATPDGVGRYKHYERGSIYWTPQIGAHEVHGAIHDRWSELGYERGLGYPMTDEQRTPDGVGRFSVFERGSIYFSPSTGAHEVYGAIRDRYRDLGWEAGVLGYPVSGEQVGADAVGRKSNFERGTIYWTPTHGAHEVFGAIREKHNALNAEAGLLGYPITGEERSPDGVGRFSVFEKGSIYFSPSTGAHEVHGAIRDTYKQYNWERGPLGYPTSDEYDVPEGKRSDFQGGSITWNRSTGQVTVRGNDGAPLAVPPPPAPPGPPPPPPAPAMRPYTVQSGDTLSSIAARNNTTVAELLRLNPQVTNPDVIQVGQVLQVPGGGAPVAPVTPGAPNIGRPGNDLVPNQFSIGGAAGQAACGPAALIGLLRSKGRDMSLQQAVDIARNYGWNTSGGMNGFGNFIAYARSQGLDFVTGGVNDVRSQVQSGKPVIISTTKHYWVAQSYDPVTNKYFCGNSGTALIGGSQWLSLEQMASLGNGINGVGWAR